MKLTLTETGQKHMAITNSSSNKLKNLELSIQLSLSGLSFCILNKDSNTILEVKELRFEKRLNPFELLDELKALFENESTLNKSFTNVTIVHNNDLSTLVPEALFNKNSAADYLKFNSKILKSDFIAYDNILENSSINVYVPYININNYIYDKFGTFIFKHISSVLIESILRIEKASTTPKVYIHVSLNHFEIIIIKEGKLELYNTFVYNSKEDFIYYILFIDEQLNLNPETLNLVFIGDITEDDEIYNIAYKYIRNISFGNRNDDFKYIDKPKSNYSNFTLLKSF